MSLALVVGLTAGIVGATTAGSLAAPAVALVKSPVGDATFAKLAEAVKPAVINVSVEKSVGPGLLEEFFGRRGAPRDRTRRGVGSGVIIDPTGIALTNAHVIEGAKEVEVVTVAGDKHKAKVVGLDKKTDLAVLRLESAKTFPFLPLGDSDAVQVGDWVIAVGSPFGLQATVTSGIVSAKARHIGAGPYDDFLQTDAAINPGNSGGPLVNMRGEVVGINTAIVSGGSGIGFAIPSNMAKQVSAQLIATGTVTRGWLGVSLQPLTSDLATSFGVADGKGVLVAEVQPRSPAAKAGLESGDVIIGFNGKKVESAADLARAVGFARPGEEVRLTVWRDRAEHKLTAKLGEQPGEAGASRLGLDVRPITPAVAQELRLGHTDGVLVTSVEPDSAGAQAGIQRGDVIRELDGTPIKSLADFERVTSRLAADRPISARLERDGTSLYVALPPAQPG
ncbi:MAG: DegQ family serine endoprotease [Candidatus Rokubacteria bacterium]|nr:DegQ family serine endoprotease [Candidatus Rokubacteria bacterium]